MSTAETKDMSYNPPSLGSYSSKPKARKAEGEANGADDDGGDDHAAKRAKKHEEEETRPVDYNDLIKDVPNYYANAKFDLDHPMDPALNTFAYVSGAFENKEKGGQIQPTCRLIATPGNEAWMADAKKAKQGLNDEGRSRAAVIYAPVLVPMYSAVYPYGTLKETNPGRTGSTNNPLYGLEDEKVMKNATLLMFDGFAPHSAFIDKTDPSGRDVNYIKKLKWMENLRRWTASYIIDDKEIKSNIKTDAMKAGIEADAEAEAKAAPASAMTDASAAAPEEKKQKKRRVVRNKALARSVAIQYLLDHSDSWMNNRKVKDGEVDPENDDDTVVKGRVKHTEKLVFKRKALTTLTNFRDRAKGFDDKEIARMAAAQKGLAKQLTQKRIAPWTVPYRLMSFVTGQPAQVTVRDQDRLFQTCSFDRNGNPVELDRDLMHRNNHSLVTVRFSIDLSLDSTPERDKAFSVRRVLCGIVDVGVCGRRRPLPEQKSIMNVPKIDASSSALAEAIAAEKRRLAERGGGGKHAPNVNTDADYGNNEGGGGGGGGGAHEPLSDDDD